MRGKGGQKRTGSSPGRGDRVAGRGSSTGLLGGGFTKKPKFNKNMKIPQCCWMIVFRSSTLSTIVVPAEPSGCCQTHVNAL